MSEQRLKTLFARYLEKSASPKERQELFGLTLEESLQPVLQELISDCWELTNQVDGLSEGKAQQLFQRIMSETFEPLSVRKTRVFPLIWKRIAIAASIILLAGSVIYFNVFQERKKTSIVSITSKQTDIASPSSNRASITLGNGQQVYLENVLNGLVGREGSVQIEKLADGEIAYRGSSTETVYNTLTNPRGSRVVTLRLADGSNVWLNAGSSITYPVAFLEKERRVSVSGEAYFEVSHQASHPFLVYNSSTSADEKNPWSVQVLGTHFNVNAYDDEPNVRITLLEGSVKVSKGSSSALLKPGEQGIVVNSIGISTQIDLEEVMAWKDGRFQFEGAGIEEVMRQIARWYDVEVVYEGRPELHHFSGGMSRNVDVSKVLKMLSTTEAVRFKIEGKKVFVMK